jgi:hypothetical protein
MLGAMRLARTSARLTATWSTLATLAAFVTFTWSPPARANGRYPASGQIAVSPMSPSTLMVRATYGLMLSTDSGKTWGWLCEPAVGYGNEEDPEMAFMGNGTLLAGIFEGLSVGTPDACQWAFVPGTLLGKYVIDLSVDKGDPSQAVLIISNSDGQDDAGDPIFLTELWQTADQGVTWTQAGVALPPQFLGLTVDAAPSNAQRVYLSGRYGAPDYPGVLERTDDRGATWQDLPIPGTGAMSLPYIGGVDPQDPDVVYVRLHADTGDSLVVTKDGGMTWSTVYTAKGTLYGFALSPDGSTVAIGGDMDGVLTAPASSLQFTQVSPVGALCLTWASSGLYACANEFVDKFTAGVSTDQGKTWTALMHLSDVCPLACSEPDSGVTLDCPALWPATAQTINASCGLDAGPSTGASSAAAASSSSGEPAGTGSKGCSCSLPGGAGGGAAALSLAGLAGLVGAVARTRRRRPRRTH